MPVRSRLLRRSAEPTLRTRLLAQVLPLVLVAVAALVAVSVITASGDERTLTYAQTRELAREYAARFDGTVKERLSAAHLLASEMAAYRTDRGQILRMLKRVMLDEPTLLGDYVVFEPGAAPGKDADYAGRPGMDKQG